MRGAAGTRLGFESLEGRLLLAADFGDAPDTYGTTIAAGGAQHGANGPMLGVTRDVENNAVPSAAADGDGADEDGVMFGALYAGSEAQIRVRVANQYNEPAKLDAWFDFDGDGTWSGALERIFDGVDLAIGQNELSFSIPSWAATGQTYARFRVSTNGVDGPRGSVSTGEVEDYAIEILSPQATAAEFAEQLVANGNKGAYSLYAVDLDRDGDQDLLASDPNSGTVTWHQNDGNGGFTQRTVATVAFGRTVAAADFDGDGRLDVLTSRVDGDALWYRQHSNGNFYSSSLAPANAVTAIDFLKDGAFEAAIAGASPGPFQILYRDAGSLRTIGSGSVAGTSVDAADVDGDGDIDVLGASAGDSSLTWFESQPATPNVVFVRHTIATDVAGISRASLVDLDRDGDLDVLAVAAGDGTIAWFENDGAQNFTRRLVAAVAGVAAITHADVDGDGDLDLLVAAGAGGAKLLLNDGAENFTATTLPTSSTVGIGAIAAADFDGDGVLEIAVGGSHPLLSGGTGYFSILRRQTLLDFGDAPSIYNTTLVENGARHYPKGPTLGATRDGEADGGSPASPDGADEEGVTFGTLRIGDVDATVTVNVQNAPAGARLDAWIDFDGDGRWSGTHEQIAASLAVVEGDNAISFAVPVLAAAGQTYARFRLSTGGNLGPEGAAVDGEVEDYAVTINSPAEGSGSFGSKTSTGIWDNAELVVSADVDGDGDADIVASSSSSIFWHENLGNGSYARRQFSGGYESPETLQVVDLDGDGDQDVFAKSANRLYWLENNGSQTFVTRLISFEASQHTAPVVIDYDRDGDLDIVIAGTSIHGVRLFQNNGAGSFTTRQLIAPYSGFYYRPTAIAVTDADGDGDFDIYASLDSYSDRLALYRNDGQDNFTRSTLVTMSGGTRDRMLTPLDFDGDGDVDLVATTSSSASLPSPATYSDLIWYENRGNGDVDYRVISDNLSGFRQAVVGDLDGDGDYDLVSSIVSFGQIVWHENLGNETFAARQLSIESGFAGHAFYFALDLADQDGDGDLDVLIGSRFLYYGHSGIYWLPQLATPARDYGDAPYPYPVTLSANGASHVATGPRLGAARDEETGVGNSPTGDGDGADDDGVTISPIRVGQMGATFAVNVQNAPAGARLDAWIDFDGDGNWSRAEERVAANLSVVEGDNTLTFEVPAWAMAGASYARFRVSTAGKLGYTGAAADGEVEDHAVVIAPPLAATGPYFERHLIDAENLSYEFRSLATVDLDRDGDLDVVAPSATSQLYWFENDGDGGFTRRILNGALASPSGYLGAADVDLDGDVDLVTHNGYGSFITLFLNDGILSFSPRGLSNYTSNLGHQLSVVDIEGDGDLDYIGSNTLIKNITGASYSSAVSPSGIVLTPSFVADVDRNGTLDLIQSMSPPYYRTPGIGVAEYQLDWFGPASPLASLTASPLRLTAADLDRDGDLDLIVAAANTGDNILWLENDGLQHYTERTIGVVATASLRGLQAADVDGDGDLDLLASSESETAWFENDGSQTFVKHVALNVGGAFSIADMNGDGALDVVLYDRSRGSNENSFGLAWYSLTDRQVSVVAAPATIDEEGNTSVVFTFTRAGVTDGELTVPFTVGGDALYGVDYTVSGAASFNATAGTITFAAGVTSVEVTLTPIDDAVKEFHEQARLAIPPLAGYSIGHAIATATIRTAELAGDYDSDGTVGGADFLAWQRSFGQTAEPIGSGADGNLDGETDGDDLAVWTENFGETTVPPTPPEVVIAALVALEEEPAMATASAAMASANWFGRLSGDEAAIIALPAAVSAAKRVERRHDVREEAFARTDRWSNGQIGVQRCQLASHVSSRPTEDAEQGDAEAFDELASELVRAWREF